MKTRDVALASIIAATYAGLVIAFMPISYQLPQLRIADCLIPMSVVLGWPAILGVTMGCVVANVLSPLPSIIIDVTFGSLANFLASFVAYRVASRESSNVRKFLACLAAALIVTFIVGPYLAPLLGWPLWLGLALLFSGSFVSTCILGYAVLLALADVI